MATLRVCTGRARPPATKASQEAAHTRTIRVESRIFLVDFPGLVPTHPSTEIQILGYRRPLCRRLNLNVCCRARCKLMLAAPSSPALWPAAQGPTSSPCQTVLTAPFTVPPESAPLTGRHVSANHKTGTVLLECFARVLAHAGIQLNVSDAHTWGFGALSSPDALHVNLVRNPFILVHSGYSYHRNNLKAEAWTVVPFNRMAPRYTDHATESYNGFRQGAFDARTAFHTCSGATVAENATYRLALNTLPLEDGLVLESFRSLHRDVPYMVASAWACYHAGASAKYMKTLTKPQAARAPKGRCSNVFLEDVTADYREGLARYLATPLNLSEGSDAPLGAAFARRCDPALHQSNVHPTDHSERPEAIELIRRLDAKHLGGALARAERALEVIRGLQEGP